MRLTLAKLLVGNLRGAFRSLHDWHILMFLTVLTAFWQEILYQPTRLRRTSGNVILDYATLWSRTRPGCLRLNRAGRVYIYRDVNATNIPLFFWRTIGVQRSLPVQALPHRSGHLIQMGRIAFLPIQTLLTLEVNLGRSGTSVV
ncbi:hypothetical protein OBBRIDRAFT_567864 [Obba rivulosa]|uniref:Uncharacterized protein n=1 Tax=Obba rivulosa TaxID=1052685 RepID=A0A8E2AUZ8_9APHY|nr:hypothetical protein OBBRIDRAFT_567864 [Obba rivulosa]